MRAPPNASPMRSVLPVPVFWLLIGMSLISMGALGYQLGLRRTPLRLLSVLLTGMWTLVIVDNPRPGRGPHGKHPAHDARLRMDAPGVWALAFRPAPALRRAEGGAGDDATLLARSRRRCPHRPRRAPDDVQVQRQQDGRDEDVRHDHDLRGRRRPLADAISSAIPGLRSAQMAPADKRRVVDGPQAA